MTGNLIEIKDLEVEFRLKQKTIKAVEKVSFNVKKGEIFALLGESGCGKSTTALSLLRLIQSPGIICGGEIIFNGQDLLKLDEKEMYKIRGKEIGMIFQNPLDSLNPVYSIGWQMQEGLLLDHMTRAEAREKALCMLEDTRIPDARQREKCYPHEISGGMRQRVMIGMMLSRNPKLLIADEPTTALDVTIQAQILDLILEIRKVYNTAVIVITHDFGIIAEIADRAAIMYAGNIVEIGDVYQLFEKPAHPYTKLLINALPRISKKEGNLVTIPGSVPNLAQPLKGCKFHERCPQAKDKCAHVLPDFQEKEPGHFFACHLGVH